ncbi:hypothetical protein [Pedobacter sp. SYSU D00535]|uniref:hypothetical protein n=1 Tax=Pedobacter sp. SYSU D00535 TaxID=2810308 RepID=UPI001A97AD54|nr:hypothetical protein [Pedobacter sp. SYSU D00535]
MMNKKEIFKKIGGIIAELTEQYQYLSENLDQINDLELELFSANSDFLAEHVKVLKKLNSNQSVETASRAPEPVRGTVADTPSAGSSSQPETEARPKPAEVQVDKAAPEAKEEPVISRPLAEPERVEEYVEEVLPEIQEQSSPVQHEEKPEPGSSAPIEVAPEPVVAEQKPEPVAPAPIVNEVVIPEKVTNIVVEEPKPVAASPQAAAPTLNDIISAQRSQQSSSALNFNTQPVKDLKSIISLNDKLLFIKDLFNGYSLAYSEALELLNRFDSFAAADSFLKTNYAVKNNWSAKQETVDKFYELLQRRFAK